jgi:hypothetical protein
MLTGPGSDLRGCTWREGRKRPEGGRERRRDRGREGGIEGEKEG